MPALVAAAAIEPRQFGTSLKLVGTEKLKPEVNPKAVHIMQKFGPVSLTGRGSGQDSGQQNFIFTMPTESFCKTCTVLKGHIGLMNMDGTVAHPQNGSGVYIHHILTFDITKKANPFVSSCALGGSGLSIGAKFVGSGEDNNNVPVYYTNKDGGHLGGFHINNNDRFFMNADIVSLNPSSSKVYITMELEYLPEIVGADSRETLLTVEACGGQSLKPSTSGPSKSTSGVYKFTESGNIILAKGHLHAGGDRVEIYINEKLACESKAIYDSSKGGGAISEMTICPIMPVRGGDSMKFVAVYDASKHPLRHETHGFGGGMPDVMGMLDLVFSK